MEVLVWMYAISSMTNGLPDTGANSYHGHVLIKELGQYGLYLFSGTSVQLTALAGEAGIVALVKMNDDGVTKYAELSNVVSTGARTKMNNWLTARGYANIPVGWTYRQILNALVNRFGLNTEDGNWVKDV